MTEESGHGVARCAACGAGSPPGSRFCRSCGATLSDPAPAEPAAPPAPAASACATCGAALPADALFCRGCGARVEPVSAAATQVVDPDDGTQALPPAAVTAASCSICGRPATPDSDLCDECARPLSLPGTAAAPVFAAAPAAQETVLDPGGAIPPGATPPAPPATPPTPRSGPGPGLIVALVIAALLVVAAGAAGTYFLVLRDDGSQAPRAQKPAATKDGGVDPRLENGGTTPGGSAPGGSGGSTTNDGGSTSGGGSGGSTTDDGGGSSTNDGGGSTTDGGGDSSTNDGGGTTSSNGGGGSAGSGSGPEQAIRQHFADIDGGDFAGAWGLLSSRYQRGKRKSGWIADKESNGARISVQAANFKRFIGDNRAQVFVDMISRDAGASTCGRFSGKLILVKEGDRWLYDPNRPDLGGTWSKRGTLSDSDPRCSAL